VGSINVFSAMVGFPEGITYYT